MILRGLQWFRREVQVRRDPVGYARSIGVTVGPGCEFYGTTPATWGSEPYLISLGEHVCVTAGVRFVTHDGTVFLFRRDYPDLDRVGPITVNDNVYFGINAIVLPNVTIGSNTVIGAGAIVTRDIPSGSVAVGVPARVVGTVDAWWEKHQADFMHVYRKPVREKKQLFLERFRSKREPA